MARPTNSQTKSLAGEFNDGQTNLMKSIPFVCPSVAIRMGGSQTDEFAGEFNDGQTNSMK